MQSLFEEGQRTHKHILKPSKISSLQPYTHLSHNSPFPLPSYLSNGKLFHLSTHPSTHPYTHPSIHPPIHPSTHPPIHPPTHPSSFLSYLNSFLVGVLRNPSRLYCWPHTQFLIKKRNPSGFSRFLFSQHLQRMLVKRGNTKLEKWTRTQCVKRKKSSKCWNARECLQMFCSKLLHTESQGYGENGIARMTNSPQNKRL